MSVSGVLLFCLLCVQAGLLESVQESAAGGTADLGTGLWGDGGIENVPQAAEMNLKLIAVNAPTLEGNVIQAHRIKRESSKRKKANPRSGSWSILARPAGRKDSSTVRVKRQGQTQKRKPKPKPKPKPGSLTSLSIKHP